MVKTGTVGDLTVYAKNGVCIGRTHQNSTKYKRLPAQCLSAAHMSNIVRLFQTFPEDWRPGFQFLLPGQSSYNRFVAFARHTPPVYLTRQESLWNVAILTPVAVSDGLLPPIAAWWESDCVVTDLEIGPEGSAEGLTVRGLTEALLSRNGGWAEGDVLLFYVADQYLMGPHSVPAVNIYAAGVTLSLADGRPLAEVAKWAKGFESVEGRLACTASVADIFRDNGDNVGGGMVWVHLRPAEKECLRSPQRLLCRNPLIERYSSFEQAMEVWKSYHVNLDRPFLEPDTDLRTLCRKW